MVMNKCIKCTNEDINIKFIAEGKMVDSSSNHIQEDDYLTSKESTYYFKVTAEKDHLFMECTTCGYNWRENTKDSLD